jgi:hypothetical protein
MVRVGAPCEAMGELVREVRERGRGMGRGGAAWGVGHHGEAEAGACLVRSCCCAEVFMTAACVGAIREEEEKEEREKKTKGRKREQKKYGKFSELENFLGEK